MSDFRVREAREYLYKMRPRRYSRSGSLEPSDSEDNSPPALSYRSVSRSRSRSRSRSPYRLHIADISDDVKKADIEKLFSEFGALKEVWLTNCPPCFGFAVFKHKADATAALDGTDGLMVGSSRIRVTFARPRTRGLGRRSYNPHLRCYQCGLTGHFYRNCPVMDKSYGSRRSRRYDDDDSDYEHSSRTRRSHGRTSRRYSVDQSPDAHRRRRR